MIYRLLAALLGLVALLTLVLLVSVLIDYGDNIQVGRMIIVALVFVAAAFGAVKLWRRSPST
ncbi:MAG: hypothetical protein ACR2NA_14580 [Solirubrobacterales bacterium]